MQSSFIQQCGNCIYKGAITLAIAFVVFLVLERLFSIRRQRKPWQATFLDLQYAFLGFLYPPAINVVFAGVFAYIAGKGQASIHNPEIGWTDFALDVVGILLARDALIYIRHRFFHTKALWEFHAVHHSSEEVDWLSALRFHPVEELIESIAETILFAICFWILSVPAKVLFVVSVVIAVSNMLIHANLNWTFGPLRYVFVSPVFHRWHHSDEDAARDKNFAAMFSFIDLWFGTFYMPKGKVPITTGLGGQDKKTFPKTILGQTAHPFTSWLTRK